MLLTVNSAKTTISCRPDTDENSRKFPVSQSLWLGDILEWHYVSLKPLSSCISNEQVAAVDDKAPDMEEENASSAESENVAGTRRPEDKSLSAGISVLPRPTLANGPCRPDLHEFPATVIGDRKRSFRSAWYSSFPWLEYSSKEDCAYCYYWHCRLFVDKAAHKKQITQFAVGGFRNWRDAVMSFNKHEATDLHTQATSFYIDAKRMHERSTSVASEVSAQHASQVDVNRKNVGRLVETVMLLGRQNIPFRGHDESTNRGNFIELLSWKASDVPQLAQHLTSKIHYTSPSSQNEIIELDGSSVEACSIGVKSAKQRSVVTYCR